MNKKELLEKRNLLIEEMEGLVNSEEVETRGFLSDGELVSYEAKKSELRNIDESIKILDEKLEKVEERKVDNMENLEKRFLDGIAKGNFDEYRAMNVTGGEGNVSFGETIPETLQGNIVKRIRENGTLSKDIRITNVKGDYTIFVENDATRQAQILQENDTIQEKPLSQLGKVTLKGKRVSDLIVVSDSLLASSVPVTMEYLEEQIYLGIDNLLTNELVNGDNTELHLEGIMQLPSERTISYDDKFKLIDSIIDATVSLKDKYLHKAKFYMNRNTLKDIATVKNSNGDYYLIKDLISGKVKNMLVGYEVSICDSVADGKVIFGDMSQAMTMNIQDGIGIQILKEKYKLANCTGLVINTTLDAKVVDKEAVVIIQPVA